MKLISRRLFLPMMALLFAGLAAAPAWAASLNDLRTSGAVIERFDGFLEVGQKNVTGEARSVVNDVNAQRRSIYEQRAKEKNVPVSEVGKLYASEIYQSAPAGTYFRTANGSVIQK